MIYSTLVIRNDAVQPFSCWFRFHNVDGDQIEIRTPKQNKQWIMHFGLEKRENSVLNKNMMINQSFDNPEKWNKQTKQKNGQILFLVAVFCFLHSINKYWNKMFLFCFSKWWCFSLVFYSYMETCLLHLFDGNHSIFFFFWSFLDRNRFELPVDLFDVYFCFRAKQNLMRKQKQNGNLEIENRNCFKCYKSLEK